MSTSLMHNRAANSYMMPHGSPVKGNKLMFTGLVAGIHYTDPCLSRVSSRLQT